MSKGSSAKSSKCCQELNVMMWGYQRVESIVKIVRHTQIPSDANDDIWYFDKWNIVTWMSSRIKYVQ